MLIDLRIFANRMPGRRSTGLFNYIDKTLMADEEKKPSIKSNCVELHKHSEKKPMGSQSVRDLNRL